MGNKIVEDVHFLEFWKFFLFRLINKIEEYTSDLIGHRFGEIEPFALFVMVDVAQTEVILFDHIQLLAHVIQQVLRFTSRLSTNKITSKQLNNAFKCASQPFLLYVSSTNRLKTPLVYFIGCLFLSLSSQKEIS